MTVRVEQLCIDNNIRYSFKDKYIEEQNGGIPTSLGSTELGRIALASKGTVNGTTLQIPTTGYHTMDETTTIDACQTFIQLLTRLAIEE